MGSIVAYLGPETEIAGPIEGGSLLHQAEASTGGFGFGWYPPDQNPAPLRLRSLDALRNAGHLLEAPRRYKSSCIIACAAFNPDQMAELSRIQPFAHGPVLFALESRIERFRKDFLRRLLSELSEQALSNLTGLSPAEVLFALWLDALQKTGYNPSDPDTMAGALEAMVGKVQSIATSVDAPTSISVVATQGACLLALVTATHGAPPQLFSTVAHERAPVPATGRVVASEPAFPGEWNAIDPHAITIFTVEPASSPTEPL